MLKEGRSRSVVPGWKSVAVGMTVNYVHTISNELNSEGVACSVPHLFRHPMPCIDQGNDVITDYKREQSGRRGAVGMLGIGDSIEQ